MERPTDNKATKSTTSCLWLLGEGSVLGPLSVSLGSEKSVDNKKQNTTDLISHEASNFEEGSFRVSVFLPMPKGHRRYQRENPQHDFYRPVKAGQRDKHFHSESYTGLSTRPQNFPLWRELCCGNLNYCLCIFYNILTALRCDKWHLRWWTCLLKS